MTGIELRHPPVIETLLSAQFSPIQNLNAAYAGTFWRDLASDPEWARAKLAEVERIEDVFEDFGSEPTFGQIMLRLRGSGESSRAQIIRDDEERMIQMQDSRFVYNWRKREGDYPSYDRVEPEFFKNFNRFQKFLSDLGMPAPQLNQWEITYVNHVPKEELWATVADWPRILPGLYFAPTSDPEAKIETVAGAWRYRIAENRAKLNITIQHGRTPEKKEVMILQMTARGPVDLDRGMTLETGFEIGHSAIVNTFHRIVSDEAIRYWSH
jgi:uncharacterized protein (TIGR04255 family)